MVRTPVILQCMVPGERRTVLSTVASVQVCQHLQPLAWTSTLTVRATSQTSVQAQTTTNGWEITVGNSVGFVDLDGMTDIHTNIWSGMLKRLAGLLRTTCYFTLFCFSFIKNST